MMEKREEEQQQLENALPMPSISLWFIKLLSLQADIIYNCLVSLSSPFISLFSLTSQSIHRAEEAKGTVDSAVHTVPNTVGRGGTILLRKVVLGFLGAAYVCIVLAMVMILAIILGVGLIHMWVEEPVFMRETLHFDYTDVHPNAVFDLGYGGGGGGFKTARGVPIGHTFYVRLVLLMPESDFNREIGMFQVIAELISTHGNVIARSSHPCMLKFQSFPIRVMQTFLMGIPLLLGITAETQKISIPMLKHKEVYHPRTEAIKISLIPRAGTNFLPQLYDAEIIMHSELPWRKELVRSWKWTFYVWTSLYIYIMLLIILVCCFRPLIFPVITSSVGEHRVANMRTAEVGEESLVRARDKEREISETMRRWKESRSKRKAMLMHGDIGSTTSSISVSREDTGATTTDDVGDSESVCF